MTDIPQGFGISAVQDMNEERNKFLKKYGWTLQTLSDYGIMLRPNKPVPGAKGGWDPKYQEQLQGYNYADITFGDLEGNPIETYALRPGQWYPFGGPDYLVIMEKANISNTQVPELPFTCHTTATDQTFGLMSR